MNELIQLHDLTFDKFLEETVIQNRVVELGATLSQDYKDKNPLFLVVLNGAFIFAADLVRACTIHHEISFIKLTSYEGLTTSGKITTAIGLQEEIAGRNIILVEDIVDTGTTLYQFLPTLQALNPKSIAIATLLLKPTALKHPLKTDYVGFKIPNKFVVGYGLDYKGLGRHLKSIYQLKE